MVIINQLKHEFTCAISQICRPVWTDNIIIRLTRLNFSKSRWQTYNRFDWFNNLIIVFSVTTAIHELYLTQPSDKCLSNISEYRNEREPPIGISQTRHLDITGLIMTGVNPSPNPDNVRTWWAFNISKKWFLGFSKIFFLRANKLRGL